MSDTSPEAVEQIAASPWCYASEDISAALRAMMAERDAARVALAETEALEMQHGAVVARLMAERDGAVRAERERCAQIADPWELDTPSANKSREYIAAAIRKGPTP